MSIKFKSALVMASVLSIAMGLIACGNGNAAPATSQKTDTVKPQAKTTEKTEAKPNVAPEHRDVLTALQANLNKAGIQATVIGITPIAMPDMYFATIEGMPPVFTDKSGTYLLQGTMVSLAGDKPVNVGDEAVASLAKGALAGVDKSEMIIFSPKTKPKASIYVFSDPTCHYCQLLHKDRDKLNALGIEIRYLAWPRSENIIPLTESVWCSADRNQAMTDAKAGKRPQATSCDNPVQKHLALGYSLGVSGTPAVFTTSGLQIGGYLPPDELAKLAIENQ